MIHVSKAVFASALAGLVLAGTRAEVQGGWSVGVRVGTPGYYRPWYPYYHYYPYYPYRGVYVMPPPVVVEAAPVVVPPAPVVQPVYPAPALPPTVAPSAVPDAPQAEIDRHLQLLRDPDERVRADGVIQLGRLKAVGTVDAVAATLAGDRSPIVREAAARALGLIGSPKALPALQHAALADPDRDVRHSAQFAVDIVQTGR